MPHREYRRNSEARRCERRAPNLVLPVKGGQLICTLKIPRSDSAFKQRIAVPCRPGSGEPSHKGNAPGPVIAVLELSWTAATTEVP
jgi:hypothetical protein